MFSVQAAAGEVNTAVSDQQVAWTETRKNHFFLGKVSSFLKQHFFCEKSVFRCPVTRVVVIALDFALSGPGSSHYWGHRFVFLGKTLHSHSATLLCTVPRGGGEGGHVTS